MQGINAEVRVEPLERQLVTFEFRWPSEWPAGSWAPDGAGGWAYWVDRVGKVASCCPHASAAIDLPEPQPPLFDDTRLCEADLVRLQAVREARVASEVAGDTEPNDGRRLYQLEIPPGFSWTLTADEGNSTFEFRIWPAGQAPDDDIVREFGGSPEQAIGLALAEMRRRADEERSVWSWGDRP